MSDLGIIIIYLFVLCMIILVKLEIKYFRFPIYIILFFSLIYALTSILQLFMPKLIITLANAVSSVTDASLGRSRYGYLSGVVGNVAYSAGYAANALAILLLGWKFDFKLNHHYPLILVFYSALVLSSKRAHFAFCLVAVLYTLWIRRGKNFSVRAFVRLLLFFIIVTVFGMMSFDDLRIFSRITSTLQNIINAGDVTSGRIVLYQRAFELISTSPIIGIGWGKFDGSLHGITLSVHNSYLQILCETGVMGLILFSHSVIEYVDIYRKKLKKSA